MRKDAKLDGPSLHQDCWYRAPRHNQVGIRHQYLERLVGIPCGPSLKIGIHGIGPEWIYRKNADYDAWKNGAALWCSIPATTVKKLINLIKATYWTTMNKNPFEVAKQASAPQTFSNRLQQNYR